MLTQLVHRFARIWLLEWLLQVLVQHECTIDDGKKLSILKREIEIKKAY